MFIQRSIPYVFFCLLLTIMCMNTAKAQCPASSPLVINSVTPTESRCQASGSATISASGGATPYTYSIIAGPSTAPAQSSNLFQSLASGTYKVQVTDNCNTSVTASVTVTGSYTVPSPTATTTPTSCPGSSDGSLTIALTGGLGPFSYSLISPSPVTVGPQASNVFTGLPGGTYTYQVSDSCGNFQTRTAVVAAGSGGSMGVSSAMLYLACDSFVNIIQINVTTAASSYRPPYTTTFTLPDGRVMTHVLTAPTVNSGVISDAFYFRYHHVTGASDPLTSTAANNCGTSQTVSSPMSQFLDMSMYTIAPASCGAGYSYIFDNNGSAYHCSSTTYTLISPAGVALTTQTGNSEFSGYPPGNGYKVIRQDCCGKDSVTFNWDSPPSSSQLVPVQAYVYTSCNENITGVILGFSATTIHSAILVSGPASVTFADGMVHTYTYPDTILNNFAVGGGMFVAGLTAGTYKIYELDDCGGKDSATFTIAPSDLRHSTFTASGEAGCAGGGSILMKATSNTFVDPSLPDATITLNSAGFMDVPGYPFSYTATNITPGKYAVSYQYEMPLTGAAYPSGMQTIGCDVITDTVVVPAYTQPAFYTYPVVANCGSTRDVALLPDSASGLQPYQFQIIAGPATTAAQPSPVFPGLAAGTYTFRMADACGNSYSANMSIDTLAVPNVSTSGGTCAGGAVTFTLPGSPLYSYAWRHPDGSTSTGDTLAFNPITAADTGTYNITVTSTIGGCTSTSRKSVTLGFCTVLQETLLHFGGQQKDGDIQLSWQVADEAGVNYYRVERSTDGIAFTPVREVAATNAAQAGYTAIDTHVPSGIVYYRLQMVGNNGAINYSQTILFNMDNNSSFTVVPTMITGNTPVRCTYPGASSTGFIRIVGVDGRVYRSIIVPAGSTATSIDVAGLARGDYFVVFAGNDTVAAIQVWKE